MKIISNDIILTADIKDEYAKLAELDLIYNEDGHYIIPENDIRYNSYTNIISYFNNTSNVYLQSGSNYKMFNEIPNAMENKIIENYFNLSNIDLIISYDKNNNIIALSTKNLMYKENNTFKVLDISKSEIRPTGKNYKSVFTPLHLQKVLKDKEIGVENINGKDWCTISKDNYNIIGKIHGRGKNKTSFDRLKIDYLFL